MYYIHPAEMHTIKRINEYSFNLNHKIGNGCSSEVYAAKHPHTQQPVAIKIIPKIEHSKNENIKIAENEIKCLCELKGLPNVLQICHSAHTKNNIYIVTELCEKGTLADLLETRGKLSEDQALAFLRQIINGYKGLTQKRIIHRDLKPSNIFVTQEEQLVLGDFGFAIELNNSHETFVGNAGSPYYMAPQVLHDNTHSSKSDIWAIGIIYLEMLYGSTPWKAKSEADLKIQLEAFDLGKHIPLNVGKSSRLFLERALTKQVQDRISFEELISFPLSSSAELVTVKKRATGTLIKTNSVSTDASDKSLSYQKNSPTLENEKKGQAKSSVFKLR